MKEVVRGIYTWSWFSEKHGYDFNGYLVKQPKGNVCIDPVEMSDETLDEIVREGVAHIVLTNRNHVRASARVREKTGGRVTIHTADARYAREQGGVIDDEIAFGAKIGPFVALDASGKSPGEIALHFPPRRILVVGDACVGKPPGACALLSEAVIDDPPRLRGNLRRIAENYDFDTLLVGDGAPILRDAREALKKLVSTFPEALEKTFTS